MFHVEHSKSISPKPVNHYLQTKDYLVSGESFELLYDTQKEMLVTYPQPSSSELAKYYDSSQYISHTDSQTGLFNFLYQSVKRYSLRKKTHLINELNKGTGTLLDIGAGTGDFLVATEKKGWSAFGMEVNPKARKLAEEKGQKLKPSLQDFKGKQFDVVTLWHVLEHIPNLEETIFQLKDLVKEGGHLIIAVPNFKSLDANFYKKYWAAFDVPRHLWHFSKKSIQLLFLKSFDLIDCRPMIFDAYYVCLLSEKYKTGKRFSLRAIWNAFRSNLKAKHTKEYSSLIYVLKKGPKSK